MNQIEFLQFVHFKLPDLYKLCKAMTYEQTMMLKKDLQRAIAVYSKDKQGKFDAVQEKAIAMMMKIEKWIKQAFIEYELKKIERNYPNLTQQGRKSMARESWERYNEKMSY